MLASHMRRHLSSPPALLLAATVAAVLAACGAGARLTADSPDQAVTAALEAAQTTPLLMSFGGSLNLDTAGLKDVPASLQPELTKLGTGGSASGSLTQASSRRRQVTLSSGGHTYTLVAYDGQGYVRQDGAGFAKLSKALPSNTTVSSATISAAVDALAFQDVSKPGQATEHYQATITVDSLPKLVEALSGSGTSTSQLQQLVTLLTPFVTLKGASVDVWISHATGGLARVSLAGSFSVNVSSIASAFAGFASPGVLGKSLPSGTFSGSLSFKATVTQFGGSVTLTQPVATATLPAASGASGAWSAGLNGIP